MKEFKNIIASFILSAVIIAVPIITTCGYCLEWNEAICAFGTLFIIAEFIFVFVWLIMEE